MYTHVHPVGSSDTSHASILVKSRPLEVTKTSVIYGIMLLYVTLPWQSSFMYFYPMAICYGEKNSLAYPEKRKLMHKN